MGYPIDRYACPALSAIKIGEAQFERLLTRICLTYCAEAVSKDVQRMETDEAMPEAPQGAPAASAASATAAAATPSAAEAAAPVRAVPGGARLGTRAFLDKIVD